MTTETEAYALPLGSWSHGTLRNEDLAAALLEQAEQAGLGLVSNELRDVAEDGDAANASEIIADAIDALQDYAPPFAYVGFHEGDGSDLGVWLDWSAIEAAERDGEIVRVDDTADLESMPIDEAASYAYALHVNDHGNATLYPIRVTTGAEVWAVV